jgi:GT2 family glycosyltransferase
MSATVAVLVVTFGSRRHFPRLKAALEAQTYRNFTLHVIDNASAPEERPSPEDFPVGTRLTQSDVNLGFAAANNLIARQAPTAEHYALLNPDAFPDPKWLAHLVEAAATSPGFGAFGSTQISDDDDRRYDGLGDCYHVVGLPWRGGLGWRRVGSPESGETFAACAAAALVRRAAWAEVGGFDERFFCYGEDVDLCFRLRLRGWRIAQTAEAVVRHVGSASSGRYSPFAVHHGVRNRIWTFVKNMPGWSFWAFAPAHAAMTLAFLGASLFRGTWRATFSGVAAALRGLEDVLRARRSIQSQRTASVSSLLAAMSWNPLSALRRAPVLKPIAAANATLSPPSPSSAAADSGRRER